MSGDTSQQLAAGTRFGSYVIVRKLGSGAYGCVYEALRQPLNRRVALKVLHRQMAQRDLAVARFVREAELVAALEHPHIVAVFDVGVEDGMPFLAMEFLEGQNLGDHLKRRAALPATEAVDTLLPIFSAVATVHDRGVVHRDLKPDNILLAQSGTGEIVPKLLDFGIAKVTTTDHALTHTNALMGTPSYMSPEQARESKHIDARSDQWALGVIAWQCLAGRRPFRGSNLLDVLNAVTNSPIEPLRLIVPETPAALEQAILGALQRDPALRHPSVWDFGWRLLPFASPLSQAKWRDHFAARISVDARAHALSLAAADRSPQSPVASVVVDPSVIPSAPSGTAGTLEPNALTLPASRRPSYRRSPALVIGAVAAAGSVLALTLTLALRPRTPATSTSHAASAAVRSPSAAPSIALPAPAPLPAPPPAPQPPSSLPPAAHAPASPELPSPSARLTSRPTTATPRGTTTTPTTPRARQIRQSPAGHRSDAARTPPPAGPTPGAAPAPPPAAPPQQPQRTHGGDENF